jgi:Transposase, Mutator family
MAKSRMDLAAFVGKLLEQDDVDALQEGVKILAQALMEAEVSDQIGADPYERNSERIAYRNGYRTRSWDTRLGTIELRIHSITEGSYFPSLLEVRCLFVSFSPGALPTASVHYPGEGVGSLSSDRWRPPSRRRSSRGSSRDGKACRSGLPAERSESPAGGRPLPSLPQSGSGPAPSTERPAVRQTLDVCFASRAGRNSRRKGRQESSQPRRARCLREVGGGRRQDLFWEREPAQMLEVFAEFRPGNGPEISDIRLVDDVTRIAKVIL